MGLKSTRFGPKTDAKSTPTAGPLDRRGILELAQLKRYEAAPEVVECLIREAAEDYGRSQAKWLLLWRRPDLQAFDSLQ